MTSPSKPALVPYRLPDGRIVDLQAEVTRGAYLVSFTLIGGAVVMAVRVDDF